MKTKICLFLLPFLLIACGHSKNVENVEYSFEEDHQHIEEKINLTLFSDDYELYAEMNKPIVGEQVNVLAHFTCLSDYKPVNEAKVYIKLILSEQKEIRTDVFKKRQPGIFEGDFELKQSGNYLLEFIMQVNEKTVIFHQDNIYVSEHQFDGQNYNDETEKGITFLKELAWQLDFATIELKTKDFRYTIKTSGELLPARGSFHAITAKSSGIINFIKPQLDDGSFVRKGDVVFSISGEGLFENNVENRFAIISSKFEQSKADIKRKKVLYNEKIVSASDFEKSMAQFKIDSAQYHNLLKEYQVNGVQITAPISGKIYELEVSDGDFVIEGQNIANILNNNKIRIHIDLPQRHFALINQIQSLNFKTAYHDKVYSLDELNGYLLTKGSIANQNSGFIPVIFEIDNDDLLVGSFVECWLLTNPIPNRLVIPKSALIEEQGNFYVYVQKSGETFEKRYIKFNVADGLQVWVTEGLEVGERIVSKGAMFIKVAATAGNVPVHAHEH